MKTRSIVFLLVLTLTLALCSFGVSAEEEPLLGTAAPNDTVTDTTDTVEDESASSEAEGETEAGDAAEGETATDGATEGETTGDATVTETDDAAEGEATTGDASEEETKKGGISTGLIVFLAVIAVIVIVVAVLWFVKPAFRERIKKFFREYKSELKKVVWSPKNDVISNTKLVLVVIVIVAVVIGLLDLGLGSLIDLVGKIGA